MSAIISMSVSRDNVAIILDTLMKKDEKWFNFTVSVNDETKVFHNDGGDKLQNCGAYPTQSREQREKKMKKWYFANGKVVWTDGKIAVASDPNAVDAAVPATDENVAKAVKLLEEEVMGSAEVKEEDLPF